MNKLTVTGNQPFMGTQIPVVLGGFGPNAKCISDKTVAEIHGMEMFNVRARIASNIKRFTDGVDFIDAAQRPCPVKTLDKRVGDSHTLDLLTSLGYSKQAITQAEHIYILSERGYAKLIKIMDTDKAWEVHDHLMDEYFQMREHIQGGTPATIDAILQDPDFGIRLLSEIKVERERNVALVAANESQRQIIADYEPKVQYVDKILSSKGSLAVAQIAADYNMSPQQLNKILHDEHIQHKVNGQWILYREHMGMGYTRSVPINITRRDDREDTISHTQWTQKGRLFIHEILKEHGIMAIIDRKPAGEQMKM